MVPVYIHRDTFTLPSLTLSLSYMHTQSNITMFNVTNINKVILT